MKHHKNMIGRHHFKFPQRLTLWHSLFEETTTAIERTEESTPAHQSRDSCIARPRNFLNRRPLWDCAMPFCLWSFLIKFVYFLWQDQSNNRKQEFLSSMKPLNHTNFFCHELHWFPATRPRQWVLFLVFNFRFKTWFCLIRAGEPFPNSGSQCTE